jgi:hypothetical protein
MHAPAVVHSHSALMVPHLLVHLPHRPAHLLHVGRQRVGGRVHPPEALVPGLDRIT